MNKIYNLTGINELQSITIHKNINNGHELILSSQSLQGAANGDTVLLDRPHFKNVAFCVESAAEMPLNPGYIVAHIRFIDKELGGNRKTLKLKFLPSLRK